MRHRLFFITAALSISFLFGPGFAFAQTMAVANQAILEWFQKPAAVRFAGIHDRSYVSWITHDGQIQMRSYDNVNKQWSDTVTVDDLHADYGVEAVDDHGAPSVLILPNGTILVFYAVHDLTHNIFVKYSLHPEDPTAWSTRIAIAAPSDNHSYNYPQPKLLPSGWITLFLRSGAWNQASEVTVSSDDSGRTWSAPDTIVDFGKNIGVYALVTNQGSQMAMVWDQRIGTDAPSNLYYAASIDGGASWQTSNEKLLALPMTASIAETVIRSQEPLFAWDVVLDKNQRPITVYTIGTGIKNRYGYVRWNGKRWVNEIVTSSRLLYGGHNFYAGGVVIDPTNPARVLLSKQRTKKELEVWSRTTTGWARSLAVTGSSKIDNFRPQFVMNDPSRRLVWAAGIYDGLQNNNWTGFGRVNIFSTTMK